MLIAKMTTNEDEKAICNVSNPRATFVILGWRPTREDARQQGPPNMEERHLAMFQTGEASYVRNFCLFGCQDDRQRSRQNSDENDEKTTGNISSGRSELRL